MSGEYLKVLYTAQNGTGQDIWLVHFSDGRWGIAVDGQCHALGWPEGQLEHAAKAYCEMVWAQHPRPR